jgi:chromosome segregation ATPase
MDIEELHRVVVQGFASVNGRLDSVDARLATVDTRLTAVEAKVDAVQGQMDQVKDALMEHGRQLKDIHAALDRKVDRDELEARH